MTSRILDTNTSDASYPKKVLGYQAQRESRNIVHDVIGGGTALSLLWSSTRTGTLQLLYDNRSNAVAAFDLLARPTTFSFAVDYLNVSPLDFWFVVRDELTLELESQTRKLWTVTTGFQELN